MDHSPLNRRTFLTLSSAGLAAGVASTMDAPHFATERAVSPDGSVVATGSAPKQTEDGVVYHRDIHDSDLMKGFPPPKDRRVTIENWTDTTDTLRWTHLNGSVVFKTLAVDNGHGPVWVLPRRMLDPEKIDHAQVLWGKSEQEAKSISVADWLRRSETDALVVLHDGHIVAEQYFGAMTPSTPHRLWSASKSVLASILAPLLFEHAVDERTLVSEYLPELAATGFAGATVRQLLDMYTGLRAPCFPSPKEIGTTAEATLKQWTFGSPEFRCADNIFARTCRAAGTFPQLPSEGTAGYYDFLLTIDRDREHGEYFYYTDPNPAALQWILERTTKTSYVEHLSRLLEDLGAECNGNIMLDASGAAVSSIGLALTARDFARWGLMLCNGGRVGSGKTIAGIKDLIDDVRRNPGLQRWSERTNALAWAPANTGYRSQLWTAPAEQGREPIPYASGAFHQVCYIDASRDFVLVKFSSFLGSPMTQPVEDQLFQNDAIAVQSFLAHVLPELVR